MIEMQGVSDRKDKLRRTYRPTASEDVELLLPLAKLYHGVACGCGQRHSASLRKQVLVRAVEILGPRGWDRIRIRRWFNNEGKRAMEVARPGREEAKEKFPGGPATRRLESLVRVDATCGDVLEQEGEFVSEDGEWSLLYAGVDAYEYW